MPWHDNGLDVEALSVFRQYFEMLKADLGQCQNGNMHTAINRYVRLVGERTRGEHIRFATSDDRNARRPVKVAAPKPPAAPPIPIAASQPKASPAPPAPSPEETDQSILSALQSAIRDMGASNKIQVPQPQAGSEHLNFETPGASPPQPAPAKGR
ncbi:MAG: hypothetical protein IPI58_07075 [Alphaproteobacteria bacterium]|nr:MAG: hypothetical protein IPI58_07075 [Alphaproteobacteria bacterium]